MHIKAVSSMILIIGCAVVLTGCLERKENLKIAPDGSMNWQVALETDSLDELYNGDAVPRLAGGWIVQEKTEKDNDGKEKFTLHAEASFKRNSALPSSFALRGSADESVVLQFPTTVKIQKRSDGTYYQFNRVYHARPFAEVDFIQQKLVKDPLKEIGTEQSKWSDDDRMKVVKTLAAFEVEKLLLFGRAAYKQGAPDSPQDGWLAVRDDMHAFLNQMDYGTLANLLQPKKQQEDDEKNQLAVQAEARKFQLAAEERFKNDLKTFAGLDASKVDAVMSQYDLRKKEYEVTEDLNDDNFDMEVQMPGEIIASNADSVDGNTARWGFKGEEFHDREIELMVTSRVVR